MEYDQDMCEWIRLYLPANKPGTSVKLEWANDHSKLFDKHKDDNEFLFIYTDGSLSYDKGTRKTGYRAIAYLNGTEINMVNRAMGEFIEVYDAEMKVLEVASDMLHDLLRNAGPNKLSRIIISSDNTSALQ